MLKSTLNWPPISPRYSHATTISPFLSFPNKSFDSFKHILFEKLTICNSLRFLSHYRCGSSPFPPARCSELPHDLRSSLANQHPQIPVSPFIPLYWFKLKRKETGLSGSITTSHKETSQVVLMCVDIAALLLSVNKDNSKMILDNWRITIRERWWWCWHIVWLMPSNFYGCFRHAT